MCWVPTSYTPDPRCKGGTPYESESNDLLLTVQKTFFFTGKSFLSGRNNLVLTLKLITMKTIVRYLFATALLGVITGVLISSGFDVIAYIGAMCLFWAFMLMPMLGSAK